MTAASSTGRTLRAPVTPWALVTVAFFSWTLARIILAPLRLNHDSAMYLHAASLLLRGDVPYVDFIDVNPPLIVYLNAVPAAIANLLHVHPIPVCLMVIWGASVVSAWVARNWVADIEAMSPRAADVMAAAVAAAGHEVWRQTQYGQREHLLTILLLPYLVLRYRRQLDIEIPRRAAVISGVAAGVALCLKPYFAWILIAPEIYWLVESRRWRPRLGNEFAAIVVVGALYAAHFFVVSAAMREAALTWLPFIANGYHVYDVGFLRTVHDASGSFMFAAMVCGIFFIPAADSAALRLARGMAAATVGAVASMLVQLKGWPYHAVPIWVLGVVACALAATTMLERLPIGRAAASAWRFDLALYIVAIVIAIPMMSSTVGNQLRDVAATSPLSIAITDRSAPDDAVLVITSGSIGPYPALALTQRRPGSRFLFFFPVPMFYAGVTAGADGFPYRATANRPAGADETRFLYQLRDDILDRLPAVMFIDRFDGCVACPDGFVMNDYITGAGPLAPALSRYHSAGTFDRFSIYELNSRRSARP